MSSTGSGQAAEAAVLLEDAVVVAGSDRTAAGRLALHAADLLEGTDRYEALVAAAQLFVAIASWDLAAEAWARAVEVAPNDVARVRATSAVGDATRCAGRWLDAEVVHRRARELALTLLGIRSPATAAAGPNLAILLKYTGGFAEAERLYCESLEVAIAVGDLKFAAVICHNLGGLCHARGDCAEGGRWARHGLNLRERASSDPLQVAGDEGALAALLLETGEQQEAEALLLPSRATFTEHLGVEHYEVAVVNGNLALVALERSDLDSAQMYAAEALTDKEAALGTAHPELASTLTTLGAIRRRAGDRRSAIELHRRALHVLAPQVDPTHPLLATIRSNLSVAAGKRR